MVSCMSRYPEYQSLSYTFFTSGITTGFGFSDDYTNEMSKIAKNNRW